MHKPASSGARPWGRRTFTIHLSDGRTAQVQADEITTRQDGSLWLLKAVAKPPTPLVPVAIFAARTWTSCFPQDAPVLWLDQPSPAKPEQPKREAYILPATTTPWALPPAR